MSKAFSVVYEDNHLIIVNKRSGILVQGDKTGDTPLSEHVKEYLKEKYNKQGNVFTGVVHRLDRPVSGLVLLAKTSKALERMNAQFRNKEIEKTYYALLEDTPVQQVGHIRSWLIKDPVRNITRSHHKEVPKGLLSELDYKVIHVLDGICMVEVKPITGRPHQIRVQLAGIGCPIIGDLKYGNKLTMDDGSICLHAGKLKFMHPVKKELIEVFAGLPNNHFWNKFRLVEGDNLFFGDFKFKE
ncbi:MAG: RluA family pseudouridine synthase [Cytophagaceae bacterium]